MGEHSYQEMQAEGWRALSTLAYHGLNPRLRTGGGHDIFTIIGVGSGAGYVEHTFGTEEAEVDWLVAAAAAVSFGRPIPPPSSTPEEATSDGD